MPKDGDVIVLRAYRPFIEYLTVFKLDNFRNDDCHILSRNICRAIGVLILHMICLLFTLSEFFVSYENNFALNESVQNVIFVIVLLQIPLIYSAMFRKSLKITSTLDCLREIVVESEQFF